MVEGGLDAAVFSVFVTPYWRGASAAVRAHSLIDILDAELARPAVAAAIRRVRTTSELEATIRDGRRAALIGIEGGHAISDSLEKLAEFASRGVRYMTLTWANANGWADSSGSPPLHGGLTPFGRQVVREMERLGMLVDVSHVADTTFWDAVDAASAPLIASHSGCRALHDHKRNLTDDQLRAVAATGGVVGIPFASEFLGPVAAPGPAWSAPWRAGAPVPDPVAAELADRRARPPLRPQSAPLKWLVDHVMHALDVAGPDHVAIGSDFDGMIVPPRGLEHVGRLHVLRSALSARGIPDGVLAAVWGGNALRVLRGAERASRP
jgi:membrane dipeptidase